MDLHSLGWGEPFATAFERYRPAPHALPGEPATGQPARSGQPSLLSVWSPGADGLVPARVASQHRDGYTILSAAGPRSATPSGRLHHLAADRAALPTVGDWVAAHLPAVDGPARIDAVLPRRSLFSRRAAGAEEVEQPIAANVDTLFIVTGLDGNYSLRRLERYVTQTWDSGARPVVLLNKADLCPDAAARVFEVESDLVGVPIHALSAVGGAGVEVLDQYLTPGSTAALVGSSGVGKSTLLNRLMGYERMAVHQVRAGDSRGRHTTSHRELVVLPGGALVIDTPGMREFQVWDEDDGALRQAFEDVETLARQCRFSDCRHQAEPGCAVRRAVDEGSLDAGRVDNFRRLERELEHLARRQSQRVARLENTAKRRGRRHDRRAARQRRSPEEE
ncbi:MAG: ribosome small subunit-dependent GTPase A [Gemmatimonadota bacterium]